MLGNDAVNTWDYLGQYEGSVGGPDGPPTFSDNPGAPHHQNSPEETRLLEEAINKSKIAAERVRKVAAKFDEFSSIPEGEESPCKGLYSEIKSSPEKVAAILEKMGQDKASGWDFAKGGMPENDAYGLPNNPFHNGLFWSKRLFSNDYPSLLELGAALNEMAHLTGGVPRDPDPYKAKYVRDIPTSSYLIERIAIGESLWFSGGYKEGLKNMLIRSTDTTAPSGALSVVRYPKSLNGKGV